MALDKVGNDTTSFSATTVDAFGRLNVGQPLTLFDSKQLHDSQSLFWDDQEVSGSGTTTSHSSARASTIIGVGASTAGKRVRQTFQRFNYQPGKSQKVLMTGVLGASGYGPGIEAGMGMFDDNNGVFINAVDGTIYMNIRSKVTGSVVDNAVAQSNWSEDPLDGTGPSGLALDGTKAQIWWCDFEWLGVGSVRTGFVINGRFIVCHIFNHANLINSVYMSTPNLPLRYYLENDGTGGAATLEHICSTVISEGGQRSLGQLHFASTASRSGNAHVDADVADTLYACIGIRLKTTTLDEVIELVNTSLLVETADNVEWTLLFNPTIAGTFTYNDYPNSDVQIAYGATANTVTGGTLVSGGFIHSGGGSSAGGAGESELRNAIRLGSAIDGTRDEFVLCVRPLSAGADVHAGIGWRELA